MCFHGLIHGLLAALVMASSHSLWALPVVWITHVLIDGAKSSFAPRGGFFVCG
ncbi:DUF3307 domain-containing protein [bacterium]|nr:DUF3307 domain-containing protein [bacterium]